MPGMTNAFSKKVENHAWSVALFTTYYNFVRFHKTLRMSPAMAAGVTDRLCEIGDIVTLVEATDIQPAKRGHIRNLLLRKFRYGIAETNFNRNKQRRDC